MAETVTAEYRLRFKDLASKGLLRVQRIAGGMGKALTFASGAMGGLAAAGIGAATVMANKFADRADEINKFSRQVDISAESMQRLEFVANRQGASFDKVKSGIEKFTKSVGEYRAGTGSLKTVLDKVDPALGRQLLKIKDNSKAFEFAVDALSKYEDTQKKAAIAAALFGRSGGASFIRIVDGGAEAFNKLNSEADKFRPPITAKMLALGEKYKDSMFNAREVVASLGDRISQSLLPVMTRLLTQFSEFVAANRELINSRIDAFIKRLSLFIKGIDFAGLADGANKLKTEVVNLSARAAVLIDKMGGLQNIVIGLLGVMVAGKVIAFASALAGLVAIIGGPVTLAIVGATAAGVFLWRNWERINTFALKMGVNLPLIFHNISLGAKGLKDAFVSTFTSLKFGMATLAVKSQAFGDKFAAVWDGIKSKIASVVKFITDKIDVLLQKYNKIAGSAIGSRLGLNEVSIVGAQSVAGPAQSRAASGGASGPQDLKIEVGINGKVEGAQLQANVSTSSTKSNGSNMPRGRYSF